MTFWAKRNGMKVSPIGATKRTNYQAEAEQARTFEELLNLHRLDFWHPTISQRSQPGWPDYAIFGRGWLAFVELKARSPATNRRGVVSVAQRRYQASIEAAGAEWCTFCLPDDFDELDSWLNERTGHDIHTDGRLR